LRLRQFNKKETKYADFESEYASHENTGPGNADVPPAGNAAAGTESGKF
jgi:hypothetical protein